jgi:hypothetical protein
VVLIHRFDVLGLDLHCHKFSSPNSLYFPRNHQFSLQISAQFDKLFAQHPQPAKAGLHTEISRSNPEKTSSKKCELAKAGPSSAGQLLSITTAPCAPLAPGSIRAPRPRIARLAPAHPCSAKPWPQPPPRSLLPPRPARFRLSPHALA